LIEVPGVSATVKETVQTNELMPYLFLLVNAKLFLPVIPIGIAAYTFTLLSDNLYRNSCIIQIFLLARVTWANIPLACVASVPVRSERNSDHAKEFFTFEAREKWGQSEKLEGRGWGRGKEGTLACKPPDFEKRPLVFTVEFIY